MVRSQQNANGWIVSLVLSAVAACLLTNSARGDRIVLRGGGEIRGKVIPDPSRKDRISVLTEKGKTPLTFEKAKIAEIINEPSVLDDYVNERAKASSTAEAQYDLGVWCEKHKLTDLASLHYEAALKQDKAFGPAHQKLGHVLYADRWLTQDELRETQGLVKYKGKWITPEEKADREAQQAVTAEQASWVRRLRVLRHSVASGNESQARAAESQLLEIREPIAVKPLMNVFSEDLDPLRRLLDRVLGLIPGPEAAAALVSRILYEPEQTVRLETLAQLERRTEPNVVRLLVKALSSTEPTIVNRSAWTLGSLNVVAAVPSLIPALFTTQYKLVMVGGTSSTGAMGASFGSVAPSATLGAMGRPGGSLTSGASLAAGGGITASRAPEPKLVPVTYQNVDVLNALSKLTGQNFGFDIPSWKNWMRSGFRPEKEPVRRVPQP